MRVNYNLLTVPLFILFKFSTAFATRELKFKQEFVGKRNFYYDIPKQCSLKVPCPILMAFHGGGGNALQFDQNADLKPFTEKMGVILVYPNGIDNHWSDGRPTTNPGVDDILFVDQIIKSMETKTLIDKTRVCATGISNGGLFSFKLACERSEVFSSISPVVANMGQTLSEKCQPKEPISILQIIGDIDKLMPFKGGEVTGPFGFKKLGRVLSAEATYDYWLKKNGCEGTVKTNILDRHEDGINSELIETKSCRAKTKIEQIQVHNGGHTWPSGTPYAKEFLVGKTTSDFSASEKVVEFCLGNPKGS